MSLQTLGRLSLKGQHFGREKLLVLLAYLSLEGPKNRKFLAELFWPDARDPLNSLAAALIKLKPLEVAFSDANQVWVNLGCDALEVQKLLRGQHLSEAIQLYQGAFAEGVSLKDLGPEVEDWIYSMRERLAAEVRMALLSLAEHEAASNRLEQAAQYAEQALNLPGNGELGSEEIIRLNRLFLAANHPARATLERTARELGLELSKDAHSARGQLRQTLLGRQLVLEQLLALRRGQVAWISGGSGMGKTTLLYEIEKHGWRYMAARSGLPFATLEPLLEKPEVGLEAVVRHLSQQETPLLFDDWERIDPESQQAVERLSRLRPGFPMVVAATSVPAFGDLHLELGPLTPEELSSNPGVYAVTDGIPSLVGSWLRSEPLEGALETRLRLLSPPTLEVYCALTLLDEPDFGLLRRALGSVPLGQALDDLLSRGLIEPTGRVRARQAASSFLLQQPLLWSRIALSLARQMDKTQALPFYRQSQTLWEETDYPAIGAAYLEWNQQLLQRGFPTKAAELLNEAPPTYEIRLALARAQERAGRNHIVTEILSTLPETPETLAVQSSVWVRYGEMEKAKEAALRAKEGSLEAQAEAYLTLGKYDLHKGDFIAAEANFTRSARLWLATNQQHQYVLALVHKAMAQFRQAPKQFDPQIYQEAQQAAMGNPQMEAFVLLNIATGYGMANQHKTSLDISYQALNLAQEAEAYQLMAACWNNIAVAYDHLDDLKKAKSAYTQCLEIAQTIDDRRLTGVSLASLAILDRDRESVSESIFYLRNNGFLYLSQAYESYFREVIERSSH